MGRAPISKASPIHNFGSAWKAITRKKTSAILMDEIGFVEAGGSFGEIGRAAFPSRSRGLGRRIRETARRKKSPLNQDPTRQAAFGLAGAGRIWTSFY